MMKNIEASILASELRAMLSVLKRRLREQGGSLGDFSPSQVDVLHWLEIHGSGTVTRLAHENGVRPQSMSAIVAALQAEGLVSGSPDPNDGRQTLISLTQFCLDKVAKGRAARVDWLTHRIELLSPEEQEHLLAAAAILRRISEN